MFTPTWQLPVTSREVCLFGSLLLFVREPLRLCALSQKVALLAKKTAFSLVLYISSRSDQNKAFLDDTLSKVVRGFSGLDFFAADCSNVAELCKMVNTNVPRFPHIVFREPKTGVFREMEANIDITSKLVTKFLSQQIPDRVVYLKSSKDREFFMAGEDAYKVVLVTDKKEAPPLYRLLALEFEGKLALGVAGRKLDEGVAQSFIGYAPKGQLKLPAFFDAETRKFVQKSGTELRAWFRALYKVLVGAFF